jgi:hypothetical protein
VFHLFSCKPVSTYISYSTMFHFVSYRKVCEEQMYCSQTRLWDGQSKFWILFKNVDTGSGSHQVSCFMYTGGYFLQW